MSCQIRPLETHPTTARNGWSVGWFRLSDKYSESRTPSSLAARLKHLRASWGVAKSARAAMQTLTARCHSGPRLVHFRSSAAAASALLTLNRMPGSVVLIVIGG